MNGAYSRKRHIIKLRGVNPPTLDRPVSHRELFYLELDSRRRRRRRAALIEIRVR